MTGGWRWGQPSYPCAERDEDESDPLRKPRKGVVTRRDPNRIDVLQPLFTLINEVILPGLPGVDQGTSVSFETRQDAAFDAAVWPRVDGDYRIVLNTGLLDGLYDLFSSLTVERMARLFASRIDRFAFRGKQRLCNLLYLYCVAWVCLHELGHILFGHVELWGATERTAFNEANWRLNLADRVSAGRDPDTAADYCRIREFEADGFATDLLHEYRFTIAGMLVSSEADTELLESGELSPDALWRISRLLLFAILCCGLLLEKNRGGVNGEYPSPDARITNCIARYLIRSCADTYGPKLIRRRGAVYMSRSFSVEDAEKIGAAILLEVFPPLVWAQAVADDQTLLLSLVDREELDPRRTAALWGDLVAIVTGNPAERTPAGRELMRISNLVDAFADVAAPYRRMELWQMHRYELEITVPADLPGLNAFVLQAGIAIGRLEGVAADLPRELKPLGLTKSKQLAIVINLTTSLAASAMIEAVKAAWPHDQTPQGCQVTLNEAGPSHIVISPQPAEPVAKPARPPISERPRKERRTPRR